MRGAAIAEDLFEDFCEANAIECVRVMEGAERRPDFRLRVAGYRVTAEVKQIDMNDEDRRILARVQNAGGSADYAAPRLRKKLKDVSAQLKEASLAGEPTLLVVYDNTPFKMYSDHSDVIQAMFGQITFAISDGPDGQPVASDPYFGKNKGMDRTKNTSVSAIAVLDGVRPPFSVRIYHNPHARVTLKAEAFDGIETITQPVRPETARVGILGPDAATQQDDEV